jgi:hypothetical protein
LTFIEWLGMHVPEDVKARILGAKTIGLEAGARDTGPVKESCRILQEVFKEVLAGIVGSGVPIGINVESLSIFKEEIDAAHRLFRDLQELMLNSRESPWAVKWYDIHKGGSAYDDIVLIEQEKELRKRHVFLAGLVMGTFGVWLGRKTAMKR